VLGKEGDRNIADGQWHHVLVSIGSQFLRDFKKLTFWVDGQFDRSTSMWDAASLPDCESGSDCHYIWKNSSEVHKNHLDTGGSCDYIGIENHLPADSPEKLAGALVGGVEFFDKELGFCGRQSKIGLQINGTVTSAGKLDLIDDELPYFREVCCASCSDGRGRFGL
jgi:hypothetical protein